MRSAVVYCYQEPLCSIGWEGAGVSSGHRCKIQLNAPPPFFFAELRCKKGGRSRIIEKVRYM